MHPFGGSPICPRCSKAVYAAEQVCPSPEQPSTHRSPPTVARLDYGTRAQDTSPVLLSLPPPRSDLLLALAQGKLALSNMQRAPLNGTGTVLPEMHILQQTP